MGKNKRRKDKSSVSSLSSVEASPEAKFCKMADGDDKQQSTTLAELHQIVKNIQYNTTVIIENNRKLERSQEELANSLAYHVKTVEEVVSKNLHIEHEVSELKKRLQTKDDDIATLNVKLGMKEEEINSLLSRITDAESKVDDVEQYTRKHNVIIAGIPEGENDDMDLVMNLGEHLGVNIERADIDICHRIHSSKGTKPIIVKFFSQSWPQERSVQGKIQAQKSGRGSCRFKWRKKDIH